MGLLGIERSDKRAGVHRHRHTHTHIVYLKIILHGEVLSNALTNLAAVCMASMLNMYENF
jgi:hypothetical protein